MSASSNPTESAQAGLQRVDEGTLRFSGNWTVGEAERLEQLLDAFPWPRTREVVWDVSGIDAVDTVGAWLLRRSLRALEHEGQRVQVQGIRHEVADLMALVSRAEGATARAPQPPPPVPLEKIGRRTWTGVLGIEEATEFVGETAAAFVRSLRHPARFRWEALLTSFQVGGFGALGIVGLLCFLIGVVLAYQSAAQLRALGANVFVVELVGISMLREIGPLLTAVIAAGRSGASYAAQIGTMKVTEEVDALTTLGIPPIDLLVVPRILALVVALPLLTVWGDVVGVLGGMAMADLELGVSYREFLHRFPTVVPVDDFIVGVLKAPVFALIIAGVGCFQGMRVSGGTDAVGRNTTTSVVKGIFWIIVADAFFSVFFNWLGM